MDDILCAIKKEKQQTDTKRPSAVLVRIGESVHEEFLNARFQLESIIAAKENVLRCVKSEIERVAGKGSFTVTAYGSVSMYLCEQESDLDVCLSPREAAYSKYVPKGRLDDMILGRIELNLFPRWQGYLYGVIRRLIAAGRSSTCFTTCEKAIWIPIMLLSLEIFVKALGHRNPAFH